MILDIERFIAEETPYWRELEDILNRLESTPGRRCSFEEVVRLYYLYERASADLARVQTFAAVPEVREYLDNLVARAYSAVHVRRRRLPRSIDLLTWFTVHFPATVRRHAVAFGIAFGMLAGGTILGAGMVLLDPGSQQYVLPPFIRNETPAERVARERRMARNEKDPLRGRKTPFAAWLFQHNVRVALFTFGLGMTFGVGTLISLLYNGVMLGAVSAWYIADGQTRFLLGWLLPHGAVELTAVLLAAQAGLLLANVLLGRGSRLPLHARVRAGLPDILTILGGAVVFLAWAAGVEAFFSQYHEPILPYWLKIAFGCGELLALTLFFTLSGRPRRASTAARQEAAG